MKLKYKFEIVEVDDELIAVPVASDTQPLHGVIKLNKSGAALFELLREETTKEDILRTLEREYENDTDSLKEYLDDFLRSLEDKGILTD